MVPMTSAASRFNVVFSSSSDGSRLAYETSVPPNLAFPLETLAPVMPYLRDRSAR